MGAEWNNITIKCQEVSQGGNSPIGDISPDLSPPPDSILSTNTLKEWAQVRDGDRNDGMWPGTYGTLYKLWRNWWEVLRDSTDLCPDLSCLTTSRVELVVAWSEESVFCLSGVLLSSHTLYTMWWQSVQLRGDGEISPDLSPNTTNILSTNTLRESALVRDGHDSHLTVQTLDSWREVLGETCYLCLTLWWCMLWYRTCQDSVQTSYSWWGFDN